MSYQRNEDDNPGYSNQETESMYSNPDGYYNDVDENEPLLAGQSNLYYRNFVIMSVAFSFNHGCVVSCLAYATSELGNDLGGYGSGFLYVFYAFTAFLLSKPVVSMIGPKNGLLIGVGGYCIYVLGFLFAILVPYGAWVSILLSIFANLRAI
jgi:hypothetical protein